MPEEEPLPERIEKAIQALPLGLREAVNLQRAGLSFAEMAETLDISEAAVKVRLHRARSKIERDLEKPEEPSGENE
ncbi:MAG: hypothetical protein OHK0029_42380 [Armatimonadaceae bacterium]